MQNGRNFYECPGAAFTPLAVLAQKADEELSSGTPDKHVAELAKLLRMLKRIPDLEGENMQELRDALPKNEEGQPDVDSAQDIFTFVSSGGFASAQSANRARELCKHLSHAHTLA